MRSSSGIDYEKVYGEILNELNNDATTALHQLIKDKKDVITQKLREGTFSSFPTEDSILEFFRKLKTVTDQQELTTLLKNIGIDDLAIKNQISFIINANKKIGENKLKSLVKEALMYDEHADLDNLDRTNEYLSRLILQKNAKIYSKKFTDDQIKQKIKAIQNAQNHAALFTAMVDLGLRDNTNPPISDDEKLLFAELALNQILQKQAQNPNFSALLEKNRGKLITQFFTSKQNELNISAAATLEDILSSSMKDANLGTAELKAKLTELKLTATDEEIKNLFAENQYNFIVNGTADVEKLLREAIKKPGQSEQVKQKLAAFTKKEEVQEITSKITGVSTDKAVLEENLEKLGLDKNSANAFYTDTQFKQLLEKIDHETRPELHALFKNNEQKIKEKLQTMSIPDIDTLSNKLITANANQTGDVLRDFGIEQEKLRSQEVKAVLDAKRADSLSERLKFLPSTATHLNLLLQDERFSKKLHEFLKSKDPLIVHQLKSKNKEDVLSALSAIENNPNQEAINKDLAKIIANENGFFFSKVDKNFKEYATAILLEFGKVRSTQLQFLDDTLKQNIRSKMEEIKKQLKYYEAYLTLHKDDSEEIEKKFRATLDLLAKIDTIEQILQKEAVEQLAKKIPHYSEKSVPITSDPKTKEGQEEIIKKKNELLGLDTENPGSAQTSKHAKGVLEATSESHNDKFTDKFEVRLNYSAVWQPKQKQAGEEEEAQTAATKPVEVEKAYQTITTQYSKNGQTFKNEFEFYGQPLPEGAGPIDGKFPHEERIKWAIVQVRNMMADSFNPYQHFTISGEFPTKEDVRALKLALGYFNIPYGDTTGNERVLASHQKAFAKLVESEPGKYFGDTGLLQASHQTEKTITEKTKMPNPAEEQNKSFFRRIFGG